MIRPFVPSCLYSYMLLTVTGRGFGNADFVRLIKCYHETQLNVYIVDGPF